MDKNSNIDANLISNILENSTNKEFVDILETLIKEYKTREKIVRIPLSILSHSKLGILEALVKYLKENANLKYNEIAQLLKRDDRTIWATYNKAVRKEKTFFEIAPDEETFNPSIFSNRNQAPLEAIITHLKSKGYSLKQISVKLNRSYKNIWLTDKRTK